MVPKKRKCHYDWGFGIFPLIMEAGVLIKDDRKIIKIEKSEINKRGPLNNVPIMELKVADYDEVSA